MIIIAVILTLIVLFLILAAMQPADFRISRSASMAANPETIFEQVNNFHRWEAWSPWAKLDMTAKNTFEGPAAGEGAIFKWSGNSKVGAGTMTITESWLGERVRIQLEFIRPFKATNISEFVFQPEGANTLVTWSMSGKNNFMSKAVGLFMNCEKMVGGQFEKGLASLKTIAENTSSAT